MNVLLVTSRNIYGPNGEKTLISRRSTALKEYNLDTDIICFQNKRRIDNYNDVETWYRNLFSLKYSLVTFIKDLFVARKFIKNHLNETSPQIIIISGWFVGFFVDVLAKNRQPMCKIYYDMHGCLEELVEYIHPKLKYKILSKLLYLFNSMLEKKLLKLCRGILVVSNYMESYCKDKYGKLKDIRYFYIPCGIDKVFEDFSQFENCRQAWREKLGLGEEDICFVYSGGINSWQMVDEIVDLFHQKLINIPHAKLIIFTVDVNYINNMLIKKQVDRNRFLVQTIKSDEIAYALTACDVGIILRENNLTNKVAFPNKFSEYIAANLQVILSWSLTEPSFITRQYQLGTVIDNYYKIDIEHLNQSIQWRKKNMKKYFDRCNTVIEEKLNYKENVKVLVDDILN